MKRYLLACVPGGIAMFIGGTLSHMVFQISELDMRNLPNEQVVVSTLRTGIPAHLEIGVGIDQVVGFFSAGLVVAWLQKIPAPA
jgi:hypothetical protein